MARRKQSQPKPLLDDLTTMLSASQDQPLCVLVVDADASVKSVFDQIARQRPLKVVHATTAAEARLQLAKWPVDLAMIDPHLPDASGMTLFHEIKRSKALTQMILMSDIHDVDDAISAMRAGAGDVIRKPLAQADVLDRINAAVERHQQDQHHVYRLSRLRRVCRKLNQAREEITQQVDILCNDLVGAYQELATQVQGTTQTSDFSSLLKHELDLEQILRRTLEYLLQKAGPTNAAVFLPSMGDEYALGGYVNYDCTRESADLLLQHMADVLAPKIGQLIKPLHITDNPTLEHWLGADAAYVADSHMVSFACRHNDEPLAVITLFRDGGQPFDQSVIDTCGAIAPLLGGYLAKVIRIHHRHISGFNN